MPHLCHDRRAVHHAVRPRQRGSSVIEVAVLLPVMMLLLMVVVQAGIYFHTRAVAVTAARKGVAAARVESGSVPDGQRAAGQFLDQNGAALTNRRIDVTRSGATATVTVSGNVASVVFGVPFTLTITVDAPVEQVTP